MFISSFSFINVLSFFTSETYLIGILDSFYIDALTVYLTDFFIVKVLLYILEKLYNLLDNSIYTKK